AHVLRFRRRGLGAGAQWSLIRRRRRNGSVTRRWWWCQHGRSRRRWRWWWTPLKSLAKWAARKNLAKVHPIMRHMIGFFSLGIFLLALGCGQRSSVTAAGDSEPPPPPKYAVDLTTVTPLLPRRPTHLS